MAGTQRTISVDHLAGLECVRSTDSHAEKDSDVNACVACARESPYGVCIHTQTHAHTHTHPAHAHTHT